MKIKTAEFRARVIVDQSSRTKRRAEEGEIVWRFRRSFWQRSLDSQCPVFAAAVIASLTMSKRAGESVSIIISTRARKSFMIFSVANLIWNTYIFLREIRPFKQRVDKQALGKGRVMKYTWFDKKARPTRVMERKHNKYGDDKKINTLVNWGENTRCIFFTRGVLICFCLTDDWIPS